MELKRILSSEGIPCHPIMGTKDFYCRDYMPAQISEDKYIQFTFKPDYLLGNPNREKYFTSTTIVKRKNSFLNELNIFDSDIILDGGNIIKSEHLVIISDKVFKDNPNYSKTKLIDKLEQQLSSEILIIPAYPKEETGHADGILRFLDNETILTINHEYEGKWGEELYRILENEKLKIYPLPQAANPNKDWAYINYLQVRNIVVIPIFNNKSDEIIIPFMENLFLSKGYQTYHLNAQNIVKHGGVLNCFSWNIKN
jgi:agmatine/peptidylarginine deiminase